MQTYKSEAGAGTRHNHDRPPVTLIYCASGNLSMAEIAINAGFEYGAQLPGTTYFPLYFADQDWRAPVRERYMAALAEKRPHMATVLDLERPDQLSEVLGWAEEAAQYVDVVCVIPKYSGAIARLPRTIGGAEVRLAYSVPTRYAGTEVPVWEFAGWPVHLLGGSPHKQMEMSRYMNVVSADGNMAQKLAVKLCSFWQPGTATHAVNRWWPQLQEAGMGEKKDAPYVAFELSCNAIMRAWRDIK